MIKVKWIFLIVISSLLFDGFAQEKRNDFIPGSFRVRYAINIDTVVDSFMTYPNNVYYNSFEIENISDTSLAEYVVSRALSGNANIYDSFDSFSIDIYNDLFDSFPLSLYLIKRSLGYSLDSVWVGDDSDEDIFSVTERKIDLTKIKSFLFIEEWNFEAESFELEKDILVYGPIRDYQHHDDSNRIYKSLCFNIYSSTELTDEEKIEAEKRMINVVKPTYEFFFNNQFAENEFKSCEEYDYHFVENSRAPLLNSYARQIFIDTMIKKLKSRELNAYDFHTNLQLEVDEIKKRIGVTLDTVIYVNPGSDEDFGVIETNPHSVFEIRSLLFTESIYIDPKTLYMKKEVEAISPVRWYDNKDGELVKEVLFRIPMN